MTHRLTLMRILCAMPLLAPAVLARPAPALHAHALQAACPRCRTFAVLDGAGHDSVWASWPAVVAQAARLSGPEASAFDRDRLPDLYRTIAQFFAQRL